MKKLAIIGSGDLARLIAYHVAATGSYEVVGYFNDYEPAGKMVDGYPILGTTDDVLPLFAQGLFQCLLMGIGYKHFAVRQHLFERFEPQVPFGSFVHPSAYVDPSARLGAGSVVLPGCVLDRNVTIGKNVLLNTAVTIAHDSAIQNHTFLSPRVAIAGFTTVGECCNIGINTTIIDNVSLAPRIQTGGGAVVCHSLVEPGLYVGVPAKRIKDA